MIHFIVPFPTDHMASVIPKPSIGAFDIPATPITLERSFILKLYSFIPPGRSHKLYSPFFQSCSKCIRILTFSPTRYLGVLQSCSIVFSISVTSCGRAEARDIAKGILRPSASSMSLEPFPLLVLPTFGPLFCRCKCAVHKTVAPISLALLIEP